MARIGRPPLYHEPLRRFTVLLTPPQHQRLARLAAARRSSVAGAIRELIDDRIDREDDARRRARRDVTG